MRYVVGSELIIIIIIWIFCKVQILKSFKRLTKNNMTVKKKRGEGWEQIRKVKQCIINTYIDAYRHPRLPHHTHTHTHTRYFIHDQAYVCRGIVIGCMCVYAVVIPLLWSEAYPTWSMHLCAIYIYMCMRVCTWRHACSVCIFISLFSIRSGYGLSGWLLLQKWSHVCR